MHNPEWQQAVAATRKPASDPKDGEGKKKRGLRQLPTSKARKIQSMGGQASQESPKSHRLTKQDRLRGLSKDNPRRWMHRRIVTLLLEGMPIEEFKTKLERYYEACRLATLTLAEAKERLEKGQPSPLMEQLELQYAASGAPERVLASRQPPVPRGRVLWRAPETLEETVDEPEEAV